MPQISPSSTNNTPMRRQSMRVTMSQRATIFMLAAAASWPAAAAPGHRSIFPPFLTVDMFIAEFRGTPHPSVSGSGSPYVHHHEQGYLAGVVDLSQGQAWCLPVGIEPAKADELVVADLAKMAPMLAQRPAKSLPPKTQGRGRGRQGAGRERLDRGPGGLVPGTLRRVLRRQSLEGLCPR